jgi:hypothetical protein
VANVRKRNYILDGAANLIDYAVGRFTAALAYVHRNFVDVDKGFRMKIVAAAHAGPLRRASIRSCMRAKASSPGISFTRPLLMSS